MTNLANIARDSEGFLSSLDDWTPQIAEALAREEGITLSPAHWEVLNLLRAFYQEYDLSPAMRIFVKHCKENLGEEKGTSIYLLGLFPESPADRKSVV